MAQKSWNLFGFEIRRRKDEDEVPFSVATPQSDDGAVVVAAGGSYGTYVDLDGSVKTEAELVTKYRSMSLHPEVDCAIDAIVNEAIVTQDGEKTVQIILDSVQLPPKIKEIILQEFEETLRLLEFNTKSYDIFRRWYIDGRLYYHVIIDSKFPELGIKELRYLDPRKIRKIKEVSRKRDPRNPLVPLQKVTAEYYLYNDRGLSGGNKSIITSPASTSGVKIAKDAVVHVTSGLTDENARMVLGYLHKAIRVLNVLRSVEDATIIYRISRAPERRIFYIDVGNLPKIKAEQYLRDMMDRHKNKLVFDSATGEIRDDRKFMTMLEDYWLPRREGGKGTEISTLPAGQNLGELSDVQYFQKALYKALNVPISRLDPESLYAVGRASQITNDEVAFAKFIDRIRLKFSSIFLQVLEKQLVLKRVLAPEDWQQIQSEIKFRYLRDTYQAELKESEILADRALRMNDYLPVAGKYVSHSWIRRNILKQSEEEIAEMDAEIMEEMNNPQYAPPIDEFESEGGGGGPPVTPSALGK